MLQDRLSAAAPRVFSVSGLTALIKEALEGSFQTVTVEGEISNCRLSSSGHVYFTLKDSGAVLSAVLFRGKVRSLAFQPADGMLVQAAGALSVYAQRGSYQIVVDSLSLAGEGALLKLLEERKRQFAAEGLFDSARKKPLPAFPRCVGVVTSLSGAALRDILQIRRRRNDAVSVVILPCPVQGAEAGGRIAAMIRAANMWRLADVLIVGRGGGSLEDLLPFSEEAVVRAVADSEIPVVSAVGHEIDWALSDYAADVRAPTPSAACELVVPEKAGIVRAAAQIADALYAAVTSKLERSRLLVKAFAPESLELRFRTIEQPLLLRFDDAKEALLADMRDTAKAYRRRIENTVRDLEGANPKAILERGYAVVRDAATKALVRSAAEAAPGQTLEIFPRDGVIVAKVTAAEAAVTGA
jgi:exodeoxyribonuclease VII large subunit